MPPSVSGMNILLLQDARHTGGGPRHVRDLARSLPCHVAVMPVMGLRDLSAVVRAARRMRADIIHSHSVRTGIVGRLASRFCPPGRSVHTYHGLPRRRAILALERALVRRTAAIIHVSPSQIARARHLGLAVTARVVMNGIDHEEVARAVRLCRQPFFPTAVAVGRWTDPIKGVAFLTEAAADLARFVEVCAIGLGAPDGLNLWSLGHQPALPYIVEALCLLGTSEAEGCPYVVLEAMSAGVPVIARQTIGYMDLISDCATGYLVDTPSMMADRVRMLAKDEPLRQAMGNAARVASAPYTLERMAAETVRVYEEVWRA